jgi:hypothetical protein
MRLLFAISVASFCTVLWIALAFARRIERERLARRRPVQRAPAAEIFEAGEYRTPRPVRPNQQVASIRSRSAVLEPAVSTPAKSAGSELTLLNLHAAPSPAASGSARHPGPSPARAAAPPIYTVPASESRQIIDSNSRPVTPQRGQPLTFPPRTAAPAPVTSPDRPLRDLSGERKSPQSARSGAFRRVDLSHYNNEDMGDLTDPYTHIVRPSGVRRAVRNI